MFLQKMPWAQGRVYMVQEKPYMGYAPYDKNTLERAHDHTIRHHQKIIHSQICGCFYCVDTYPPTLIREWIDGRQTALCPKCRIDSVIGSASGFPITREFLESMHRYWFGREYSYTFPNMRK